MMLEQIFSDPSKIGASVMMLAAIYAFMTGRVITRGHHDQIIKTLEARNTELQNENKELKGIVFRQLEMTERALKVADKEKP